MSIRAAYFDSIDAISAWWALAHVLSGWTVCYFHQTRAGRILSSIFRAVFGGRATFRQSQHEVGDFHGLYLEVSRLTLAITEEWSRVAHFARAYRFLPSLGQPRRVEAYLKKATLLQTRRLLQRILMVERLATGPDQEVRLVVGGSAWTRWLAQEFQRQTRRNPRLVFYATLPSRLCLLLDLARYYAGLLAFILKRGVALRPVRERYLLAKPAMWPIGGRRGDDFLVDSKTIFPSDLLLYYRQTSGKQRVHRAVAAARKAGYRPVVFDRVPVPPQVLLRPKGLETYMVGPLAQAAASLMASKQEYARETTRLMLRLRRQLLLWDVFLERYSVGCLLEGGVYDEQVAATMAVHDHGGVSVMFRSTDEMIEASDVEPYLTHHCHFTWGQGGQELWRGLWYADEIVPAGYLWGHLHRQSLNERQRIRARFGVRDGQALVVAFDTSASGDSHISHGALKRFYEAISLLAESLDNAVVVAKPKNLDTPRLLGLNPPGRLVLCDALETDTNELIAAADLVVNMSWSTTGVEALLCGVPALMLDETGRDWRQAIARPDALVVEDAQALREAVARALKCGIDAQAWRQVQEQTRRNYGEVDGLALDRIRAHILRLCQDRDARRTGVQPAALVSSQRTAWPT